MSNSKQRDEWNGASGSRWLDRHETIDKQIAPFGHRAMDAAAIGCGHRILDIGCGCGETSFDLARRVGDTGSVLGVDISSLLIEAARGAAQQSGVSNVRFEEADAQTHSFQHGSFDLDFSRFGIMFFEDPDFAFRNIYAAVRPGGGLAFVAWPAPSENPFLTIPIGVAARYIPLPTPGDPTAPGPFAFADIERVRGVLSRVGFTGINVDRVVQKVGGGSFDETTELLLQLGPLADLLNTLDDQTRRAIRTDVRSALGPFEASGRVLLDAVAWLVTARH
jgi:ubiquinone/menaquinone biosynthesis C-methylase UbiE